MSTSGGKVAGVTPATTVTGPDAFGAAAAVGAGTDYARNDHDHGLPAAPAVPAAGTTVTGPDAFGAAAVVGVSTDYSRKDHNHGLPASPVVPTAATTVTGPDVYGAAAAVGVGTHFAREDHDHGLPAAPSPALTSAAGHLAADYNVTAALATFLTTAALGVGTWLVNLRGAAEFLISTVKLEGIIAAGSATATLEGALSFECQPTSNNSIPFGVTAIVTVTVAGTLVFQVKGAAANGVIKAATGLNAFANATGYTAVKIG